MKEATHEVVRTSAIGIVAVAAYKAVEILISAQLAAALLTGAIWGAIAGLGLFAASKIGKFISSPPPQPSK